MGDIFDRALTIYVRHFGVFALILLTVGIPIVALEAIYMPELMPSTPSLAQQLQQIEHPPAVPPPFPYNATQLLTLAVIVLIVMVVQVFAQNAIAVGVSAAESGVAPTYRASFARVFARALPLIGTMLLNLGLLVASYLAFIVVAVVVGLVLGVVAMLAKLAAFAFAVAFAVILILVYVPIVLFIVIGCSLALYGTTLESESPYTTTVGTFRRLLDRREIGRALLVMLVLIGIGIAGAILTGIFIGIGSAAHSSWLQYALGLVVSTVVTPFTATLLAVYYLRLRESAGVAAIPADIEEPNPNEPIYAATAYASGEDRALIHRFLDRRATMSADRRAAIARELAERVRPHVPVELQRLDDESLLERL